MWCVVTDIWLQTHVHTHTHCCCDVTGRYLDCLEVPLLEALSEAYQELVSAYLVTVENLLNMSLFLLDSTNQQSCHQVSRY